MTQRIVVTGGAGYIGSHVSVELLESGREILIIDNFSNAHPEAVARIEELGGRGVEFLQADLADAAQASTIVERVTAFRADGAIHLAGLKAVGESVQQPAQYYQVNIGSALTLVEALSAANAKTIVFSSSATVYGELNDNPVTEEGRTGATNPYGRTKLFIEEILRDIARADSSWGIVNLRYFNPVGAHPSGRIGEDPNDTPNNLFPLHRPSRGWTARKALRFLAMTIRHAMVPAYAITFMWSTSPRGTSPLSIILIKTIAALLRLILAQAADIPYLKRLPHSNERRTAIFPMK